MFLLLQIIVETGQIGRQASGSVIVRDGETVSIREINVFIFCFVSCYAMGLQKQCLFK